MFSLSLLRLAPYFIIGLIILGIGYQYGHLTYKEGYNIAWEKQQNTIKQIIDKYNAETEKFNSQVSKLENDSLIYQQQIQKDRQQLENTRAQIITEYKERYIQVSKTCGWDTPTVNAINKIIEGTQK
jgi:hypothetical protein